MSVLLSKIVYSCNGNYSLIRGHMAMSPWQPAWLAELCWEAETTDDTGNGWCSPSLWEVEGEGCTAPWWPVPGRKIGMCLICSDRNAVNLSNGVEKILLSIAFTEEAAGTDSTAHSKGSGESPRSDSDQEFGLLLWPG